MDIVAIVGVAGATASVASFAPQAGKIIRDRAARGLSLASYSLTCCAFACWTWYGFLRTDWALIVPNAICLGFAVFIWVMIAIPDHATRKVADAFRQLRRAK